MQGGTHNTREYRGGGKPLPERILVTDAILNDDYCGSLLVDASLNLRGGARLVNGFMRADDVVELSPCLGHASHDLRVCRCPVCKFHLARLLTIMGAKVVLAMVSARYPDTIRLDGVIVGAGHHC